jgi:hypothetical protein
VIIIKANPGRVEEVAFTGDSPAERAIEASLWPVILPFVNRLDHRLRRLNRAVVRALERGEAAR